MSPEQIVEMLTRRPDWRYPTEYPPAPELFESLEWWGFEFARRRPDFPQRALTWLKAADLRNLEQFQEVGPQAWKVASDFAHDVIGHERIEAGPYFPSLTFRYEGIEVNAEPDAPHRMTLVFDLHEPVGPQVERARDLLLTWQRAREKSGAIKRTSRTSVHRGNLPTYLRVLDAIHAGETPASLAGALRVGGKRATRQQVSDWLASARRCCNEGYAYLLTQSMPVRAKK